MTTIALGGFYSYNGMSFYEYMGKKLHFMFGNRPLLYVSTEGEPAIRQMNMEQSLKKSKKHKKSLDEVNISMDKVSVMRKQEEFEASKQKMKKMLIGLVAVIVLVVVGLVAYKYFR